jgi:hypothetical protein
MTPATLTFTTSHGAVLCAEDGGGPQGDIVAGRPAGLAATRPVAAGPWEQIDVTPEDDTHISLWSSNGFALCAEADGSGVPTGIAVFNRTEVGPWERWKIVDLGDGLALQAFDGRSYLVAESDGRIVVRVPGPPDLNPEGEPGAWETFIPSDWDWLYPPQDLAPPRIKGQLRIEGGSFAHDDGPICPVLCHAGDLIGQGLVLGLDRILPALDDIAAAGYHGVRAWWCVWPPGPNSFWDSKPAPRWDLTAANFDQHAAILKAGVDRGLAWHLAAGGLDAWNDQQCIERYDRLADLISVVGPTAIALCEACNESRDTSGGRTPEDLERYIQRVRDKHPQLLYSLTSYTGHEDREVLAEWTADWMEHYLVHGYRGGMNWDKIRHAFSLGYDGEGPPVRRNGWQGEPTGPGPYVSVTENQGDLDDEALALLAAMAACARQAWNYMSSPGVIYGDPDTFPQMAGFAAVPRLLALLPADVMTYGQLAHGGDTWKALRPLAAQGEVRTDFTLASDGRFVSIVYGPPGTYDIEVTHGFEGTIIEPATGVSSPVSALGGSRIRMSWASAGRVVVGKM